LQVKNNEETLKRIMNLIKPLRYVQDVEIYKTEDKYAILKVVFSERQRYFYILLKNIKEINLISYDSEKRLYVLGE